MNPATSAPNRSTLKPLLIGLAAALLFTGVAFVEPGFLNSLELKLLDLRFSIRGEVAHDSRIVVVDIDDRSIADVGKWPWKRSVFGDLVSRLNDAGAKVIVFDVFFQKSDQDITDPENLAFAEQMKTQSNVILPFYFNLNKTDQLAEDTISPENFSFLQALNTDALEEFVLIRGFDLFSPTPGLAQAAFGVGHINIIPDTDGITRKEILAIEYKDTFYPSLGLRTVQRFFKDTQNVLTLDGAAGISTGETFTPVRPVSMSGAMVWGVKQVNYRGGFRTFNYFSVSDVLKGRVPSNAFFNKIVLIGATAPGLYDIVSTPHTNVFPGVERHANVIDNLLNENFITRPYWADMLAIGVCLGFGLLVTFLFPKINPTPQVLLLLCLTAGYTVLSHLFFTLQGVWLNMLYPVLALWGTALPMLFLLLQKSRKAHAEVQAESDAATKMLGLSFMEKGMLEMAYDHFARLPLTPETMRILYTLANELVRKRKNVLAVQIYKDLYQKDNAYEDVTARLSGLGVSIVQQPRAPVPDSTGFLEDITQTGATGELKPGQTLGRYEIIKVLGQGAMGVVYLGKDPTLDRPVALKTFTFEAFADDETLVEVKQSFQREARLAAGLNHPHIVTIFDAGEDWDLSYIAMEVLEGRELKVHCTPGSLLAPAKVYKMVAALARALDDAHQNGVIHRDIKPANIMIIKGGGIKITDFGIALAKGEIAAVAGTPAYMAPEQFTGEAIDGRTDLYGLGVVLFEMLTGQKPFTADTIEDLRELILHQSVSSRIPETLAGMPACVQVLEKLLAKKKEDRFADGKTLAQALDALAAEAAAAPTTPAEPKKPASQPVDSDATVQLEKTVQADTPPADDATVILGDDDKS